METLFEAQKIYEAGRYDGAIDKAIHLLSRMENEAPSKTHRAREIIVNDITTDDLAGRINVLNSIKFHKRKTLWRRLWGK